MEAIDATFNIQAILCRQSVRYFDHYYISTKI